MNIPKVFFNIANSIAYIIYSILIFKIAKGNEKLSNFNSILLYAAIQFAVWFFIKDYSSCILWLSGACNYLWGMVIILLFLLPYYNLRENSFLNQYKDTLYKKLVLCTYFILCFIAGACNENTSGAGILMAILYTAYYKISSKRKIPIYGIVGIIIAFTGFLFMIMAPGNQVRLTYFGEQESDFFGYFTKFITLTNKMYHDNFKLILTFIVLYVLVLYTKSSLELKIKPLIFAIASFACNYAMILSPFYPDRAMFGTTTLLIIACAETYVAAITNLTCDYKVLNKIKIILCMGALFLFLHSYLNAFYENIFIHRKVTSRVGYIMEAKEKGEKDIVIDEPINHWTIYCAYTDITTDQTHWYNKTLAAYYDINSIRLKG